MVNFIRPSEIKNVQTVTVSSNNCMQLCGFKRPGSTYYKPKWKIITERKCIFAMKINKL